MKKESLYKVIFNNHNKIYELYAKNVFQSDMHGFIVLESLTFSNNSKLLVDPSEERLQAEFAGVNKVYVPVHYVIRIDEVTSQGKSKITVLNGKQNNTPNTSNNYYTE